MGLRTFVVIGLVIVAAMPFAEPLAAQQQVDLRLVLAVDASGSVNQERFELQRQGYAAAFRNRRVLDAILSGPNRKIAVTVVHWTGPALQVQVVPWMEIADAGSMEVLARAIETEPRQLFGGGTSISGAIDHGAGLIARSPFSAPRSVIDISGDGANNRGRPAQDARDEAVAAGLVINGLPILEVEPDLAEHYRNNVIGGPNAFLVEAKTFAEFSDAILKKLIIEIADGRPQGIRLADEPERICKSC
ncbi:MAG: DUF1194 domain-containing protein [Proteobacteria bacterium]|nr:DUF1194 domain-containing protein [Pseudomonadota bacterium]